MNRESFLFLFQANNAEIYHNTISLYNVHSYMFRRLVILKRLCNLAGQKYLDHPEDETENLMFC